MKATLKESTKVFFVCLHSIGLLETISVESEWKKIGDKLGRKIYITYSVTYLEESFFAKIIRTPTGTKKPDLISFKHLVFKVKKYANLWSSISAINSKKLI